PVRARAPAAGGPVPAPLGDQAVPLSPPAAVRELRPPRGSVAVLAVAGPPSRGSVGGPRARLAHHPEELAGHPRRPRRGAHFAPGGRANTLPESAPPRAAPSGARLRVRAGRGRGHPH